MKTTTILKWTIPVILFLAINAPWCFALENTDSSNMLIKHKPFAISVTLNSLLARHLRTQFSYNFSSTPFLAGLQIGYQPGIWDLYYDSQALVDFIPEVKFNNGYGYLLATGLYYRISKRNQKNRDFVAIGIVAEKRENYSPISKHYKKSNTLYLSSLTRLCINHHFFVECRMDIGYRKTYHHYSYYQENINRPTVVFGFAIGYAF